MKIGVKLPHSLTLSLCATAKAVSDEDVNIDSFVVLCEIQDATDILDINFYDDLICIFQVNVLKKKLTLSITCPQFSDLRQFKQYENGQWARMNIKNQTSDKKEHHN